MNFLKVKEVLLATVVASLLFLPASCSKEEEKKETVLKGVEVTAGYPVKKTMTEYINLNGNSAYLKQEIIRATFQGFIDKVYKNIGDGVKQGDPLFSIRTKEADAVTNSRTNIKNQQFSGLVDVSARTGGVLIELVHQAGDYISDGDQMATIIDPQSLRIMLEVPFQYSKLISENGSYRLKLPDGRYLSARVAKKIPSIDPVNQTQKFILEFNNKTELPANLNIGVLIPLKSYVDAIALPKSAVMANETQTEFWVMKLMNDSIAVKFPIRKGIEMDSLVQVEEPRISLTDRFVVNGAYGLPDSVKIALPQNNPGKKKEE